MLKIMFVCHGNICRSPMAEFIFKDILNRKNIKNVYVASSATSTEALGSKVHYGTANKLNSIGISTKGKYAVQLKKSDYDEYDYIIGMDSMNIRNILRITNGDPKRKIFKILEFADSYNDVADPWYTGDFDTTYNDIKAGCDGLMKKIESEIR